DQRGRDRQGGRHPEVQVPDLRRPARDHDARPARRNHSERPAQGGAARRGGSSGGSRPVRRPLRRASRGRLMAENILEATQVRKEFGGLVASNDVDFTIPEGAVVSLIGPNGAGKTTFFNQLTGVYKPTSGSIVFRGQPVQGLPPHKITQLGMARTFQNIRLFHNMTAVENVQVGMHHRLKGGVWATIFGLKREREEEKRSAEQAKDLLRFVGLR